MTADIGAVGDRGLCSCGSGTGFAARRIGKKRSYQKLLAALALVLVVVIAAGVSIKVNPDLPRTVRSSSTPWIVCTIGSGGPPSLAIDSFDNVHISYWTGEGLKYAINTGGSWSYSSVPNVSASQWPICISLAVDSKNYAHICYSDDKNLRYTTNVNNSWTNSTIESGLYGVGPFNSIALDSNDKAHVSYNHYDLQSLKYATNVNGSWVSRNLLYWQGFYTGVGNSIAIDSNNEYHISCVSHRSECLYLRNGNLSAAFYGASIEFASTSIAVDSNDKVHICWNTWFGALQYSTNANGSWVSSGIDYIPPDPRYDNMGFSGISLALDSKDNAHISYHPRIRDVETGFLTKYATNADGGWQTSVIDNTSGYPGLSSITSLGIDSNDNVHIAFTTPEGMKYATNAEPIIPEFETAGVVVVIIATVCSFVAIRRTSLPSSRTQEEMRK